MDQKQRIFFSKQCKTKKYIDKTLLFYNKTHVLYFTIFNCIIFKINACI